MITFYFLRIKFISCEKRSVKLTSSQLRWAWSKTYFTDCEITHAWRNYPKKWILVMLKNHIKESKEVHRKQLSPMYTDNTFSSYLTWNCLNRAQMVSIIQQIHIQHYLSITGKKCLSRRYDHSLSRRLQTTWEVTLHVVSFILTAHLHGLRHVHIWKTCSFQQQSNSVSVYMCSRGSRQKC